MRPHFQRHTTLPQGSEHLRPPFLGSRHTALEQHLTFLVQRAAAACFIPQVYAHRDPSLAALASFPLSLRTLCHGVILLHAGLLLHFECVLSESLCYSASRPAF